MLEKFIFNDRMDYICNKNGKNLLKNIPPAGFEPVTSRTWVGRLTYYSMATFLSKRGKFCNFQEHMQCKRDSLFCLHEFPFLLTGNFFFAYRNFLFYIQDFPFLLKGISRISHKFVIILSFLQFYPVTRIPFFVYRDSLFCL